MFCFGSVLGPQLITEIGNICCFLRNKSLVAFAAPPVQHLWIKEQIHFQAWISRTTKNALSNHVHAYLTRACWWSCVPFLDRKRQEGKHYYAYMMATTNKFLWIYCELSKLIGKNRLLFWGLSAPMAWQLLACLVNLALLVFSSPLPGRRPVR